MVEHVNEENFEEEILYSDIPVVVDFWATWCAPCLAFAPTFKKLSKKYEGRIKFLKCDVGKNKALADLLGVKAIPTLLFFCDGEVRERATGKYDTESLEEKLKNLMKKCQE
ncbi:MAG: thioredoxin [Candidatus Aenigmarchaeota archaeon]|nr:thioredoxin [Candidatus Aenigmarchaeota archaeon]